MGAGRVGSLLTSALSSHLAHSFTASKLQFFKKNLLHITSLYSSAILPSQFTNKRSAHTETKEVAPALTQGSGIISETRNGKAPRHAGMSYIYWVFLWQLHSHQTSLGRSGLSHCIFKHLNRFWRSYFVFWTDARYQHILYFECLISKEKLLWFDWPVSHCS